MGTTEGERGRSWGLGPGSGLEGRALLSHGLQKCLCVA